MTYCEHQSEPEAIRCAMAAARQSAEDSGTTCEELVLLDDGDTLHVIVDASGEVATRREGGWRKDGLLHLGPEAVRIGLSV